MLQVSKLDTLAGIAIKYNVEVGALKVANGLYSDMSLFARDHVKIPKKKLPPSMYSMQMWISPSLCLKHSNQIFQIN